MSEMNWDDIWSGMSQENLDFIDADISEDDAWADWGPNDHWGGFGEVTQEMVDAPIPDEAGQGKLKPWWLAADEEDQIDDPLYSTGTITWKGQRLQQVFNTTEFLNYITSECKVPESKRLSHNKSTGNYGADLGVGFDGGIELANFGWKDGVQRAKNLKMKLHDVLSKKIPLPEIQFDVTGLNLDIGKFVEGEPEQFMYEVDSAKDTEKKGKQLVHIVTTVDIASPEGFINRGASICALVELLEMHNIRCQVDCHVGTNNIIDTWIRVKNYENAVNIENMVFYTAHPVMFYRFAYAAWVRAENHGSIGEGSNWGYISEPLSEDRGDVYVSALGSRWISSEATCLEWITSELVKAGIKVSAE